MIFFFCWSSIFFRAQSVHHGPPFPPLFNIIGPVVLHSRQGEITLRVVRAHSHGCSNIIAPVVLHSRQGVLLSGVLAPGSVRHLFHEKHWLRYFPSEVLRTQRHRRKGAVCKLTAILRVTMYGRVAKLIFHFAIKKFYNLWKRFHKL